MAFLQRVAAAARQGVLAHIRLAPASAGLQVGAASAHSLRLFASASYLDKSEVTTRVLDIVKNFDKVEPSKVTDSASFEKDLGLDSLDTVELVMAIEEEFAIEIPDSEADKILSIPDAVAYIAANPQAK